MKIGCPKEIKIREFRVGIIPASARALVAQGHQVFVQKQAGVGSGITDEAYVAAGAQIVDTAEEIWQRSDMIVKVKEPMASEFALMRPNQILYTFLHLAAEPKLTMALLEREVTGVAYETIQIGQSLPLLKPSSEVAGRMAVQVGAYYLESHQGGKGLLLGGVTGVARGKVTILGGGVVGTNAAKIAVGMGADVTLLDTNLERLEYLDDIFAGHLKTLYSTKDAIAEHVANSDLVIGGVLIAGAKTPKLVTRDMVKTMSKDSVIVDVAVDQGGCVETMHATTHDDPIFLVDGVIHYGVSNMPGAVARTSTFALSHATMRYMCEIANLGIEGACKKFASVSLGINTYKGKLTYPAVAEATGLPYTELRSLMHL